MSAAIIPIISALISGGGAALGGYFNRQKPQDANPSAMQQTQKDLIDQLLASIKGNGPFSDLFNFNEDTFNKSYLEPAKQMFNSQIAPQIQQSFIANGQQRSTGMENQLTRAGVDMDQLLNQAYGGMQQNAQQNKMNAINSILGMGAGAGSTPGQTGKNAAGQGFSGYLTGEGFGSDIQDILAKFMGNKNQNQSIQDTYQPQRKGFERQPQYYDYKTGVMG